MQGPQGSDLGDLIYVTIACLFALAVLIQTFLAGGAALLAPEQWGEHVAWVHIFQWICLALPISSYFAQRRITSALLNCLPILLIAMQYVLIHLAIKKGDATLVGFHAVGGVVLFGILVFLVQEWRYRRTDR
jgi:hypothetical protein